MASGENVFATLRKTQRAPLSMQKRVGAWLYHVYAAERTTGASPLMSREVFDQLAPVVLRAPQERPFSVSDSALKGSFYQALLKPKQLPAAAVPESGAAMEKEPVASDWDDVSVSSSDSSSESSDPDDEHALVASRAAGITASHHQCMESILQRFGTGRMTDVSANDAVEALMQLDREHARARHAIQTRARMSESSEGYKAEILGLQDLQREYNEARAAIFASLKA